MTTKCCPVSLTSFGLCSFKVSNGFGGVTLSKKHTHERTRTRMDIQTDRPRQINVSFFLQEKAGKMSILRIRLQYFKGHVNFLKFCHHRINQYMYKHQKHKIIK